MADFPSYLAVIGQPIEYSLSPAMHRAAFQALSINACYTAFDVAPERLGEVVQAMRTLDFRGFNVTIPHKQAVIDLLDECTPAALRIGAVNTVYVRDGVWIGDNTDGAGYLSSLSRDLKFDARGKRAVILGAGGAARGVADALLGAGIDELWLLNRHRDRAETLARELSHYHAGAITAGTVADWPKDRVDLLVNTTPVGMEGHLGGELPIPEVVLHEQMTVSDIVYRPLNTPLLEAARRAGAKTHGGLGMLVEQGALALARWFGVMPPVDVMRDAARALLARDGLRARPTATA